MKMITKTSAVIGSGIFAITLLSALSASALAVSANTAASAQAGNSAPSAAGIDVSASGTTNVGSGTGADVNAVIGASSSPDAAPGAQGQAQANQNAASAGARATADLTPIVMTRADISATTGPFAPMDATVVQTQGNLSSYVGYQLQSDENLSSVDTSSQQVAVTYKGGAKLFGFIPVSLDTTATTDDSGKVTVSYPWWAFMASTADKSKLQGDLQANVTTALAAHPSSMQMSYSASQQAALIASMKSAMETDLNADASASANANASGSANY
jgi:hypothetical protein